MPHAPRVAGYALHALPPGSPIPWHRVVAAGGRLSLGKLDPSFVQLGSYVQKGDALTFDEKARKVYPQVKKIDHVHTAGNSSGIVDGAAAVLISSPDYARSHGLKARARVRAMATQSAIVAPSMGTKGTTSTAPMRGCSPECWRRSIDATARSNRA